MKIVLLFKNKRINRKDGGGSFNQNRSLILDLSYFEGFIN